MFRLIERVKWDWRRKEKKEVFIEKREVQNDLHCGSEWKKLYNYTLLNWMHLSQKKLKHSTTHLCTQLYVERREDVH